MRRADIFPDDGPEYEKPEEPTSLGIAIAEYRRQTEIIKRENKLWEDLIEALKGVRQ